MFEGIVLMLISLGAIAAGRGHVAKARQMRGFQTARGRVIARELAVIPSGDVVEGRWGRGGGYWPKATYTYEVGDTTYTGDRRQYGWVGLKQSVAQAELDAIPDEVEVHYDPSDPQDAYLIRHKPALGHGLVAGGTFGVLIALVLILGS